MRSLLKSTGWARKRKQIVRGDGSVPGGRAGRGSSNPHRVPSVSMTNQPGA
jgi:hypothetical protein